VEVVSANPVAWAEGWASRRVAGHTSVGPPLDVDFAIEGSRARPYVREEEGIIGKRARRTRGHSRSVGVPSGGEGRGRVVDDAVTVDACLLGGRS